MAKKRFANVIMYRDKNKKYRWKIVAANGKTLSCSSEGYTRKIDCRNCMRSSFIALSLRPE